MASPCERCRRAVAPGAAFCAACGQPHHAGLVGRVIAERYQVLGFVGAGGMGRVYRAEHVALEREVALKVLAPEYAGDRELLERFRREAVATSRLAHPNVVAALDFGVTDGLAFFVMEWLPVLGLDEVLARSGPMAPVRALHLAQQAAAALGAAHARRIVHRDVKPGNLMVMPGDLIKVVDFGLAQLRDRAGR
jgi:serine/threonine protein kinase